MRRRAGSGRTAVRRQSAEIHRGPRNPPLAAGLAGGPVDVGAARLIHRALIDLRDSGSAVLVISEELDELFTICDRIAVLTAGRLSAAHPRALLTVEAVGLLMTGAAPATAGATPECVDA